MALSRRRETPEISRGKNKFEKCSKLLFHYVFFFFFFFLGGGGGGRGAAEVGSEIYHPKHFRR